MFFSPKSHTKTKIPLKLETLKSSSKIVVPPRAEKFRRGDRELLFCVSEEGFFLMRKVVCVYICMLHISSEHNSLLCVLLLFRASSFSSFYTSSLILYFRRAGGGGNSQQVIFYAKKSRSHTRALLFLYIYSSTRRVVLLPLRESRERRKSTWAAKRPGGEKKRFQQRAGWAFIKNYVFAPHHFCAHEKCFERRR